MTHHVNAIASRLSLRSPQRDSLEILAHVRDLIDIPAFLIAKLKWVKPGREDFQIHYHHDEAYEPDFVVETKTAKYLCEPKRADQMNQVVSIHPQPTGSAT